MATSIKGNHALIPFNFQSHEVRTVIRDGAPWFVAKDVCDALGYVNSRDAVADHLDDDERSTVANSDSRNGGGKMTIINESGLYALVLRSRKPAARKFAKWVTGEVLPAIRQTGSYNNDPERLQRAFEIAAVASEHASRTAFAAALAEGKALDYGRWIFGMGYDRNGQPAPWAHAIRNDEFIASIDGLIKMIDSPDAANMTNQQLAALAAACAQRLTARIQSGSGRTQ